MVDDSKLSRLRELYGEAKGGEMRDPHFRRIAEQQFVNGERRKWPFADVASFLAAPYRPELRRSPGFRRARVRADRRADGSRRHQPAGRALRAARGARGRAGRPLRTRARDVRRLPRRGFADIGDVPMRSRFSLARLPRRHRGLLSPRRRGGRRAAVGRRRSFDQPADPEGGRREAAGRHAAYRRPLRHLRAL